MRVRAVMDMPKPGPGWEKNPKVLGVFFDKLTKTVKDRDAVLALAINMLDIQIVDAAPTAQPDYGEPAIVLYENGGVFRVYFYFGSSGWKYATLS